MHTSVRFAGFGGQGLLTAGFILAEAAGIYDGKYVSQTQAYGAEARGGTSRADVVVSDRPIVYPKPIKLDILVAMNQEALDKYSSSLVENGYLLADQTYVKNLHVTEALLIPFTEIARDEIGNVVTANVVALGALIELTGIVSKKAIEEAVSARVPKKYKDLNLKALDAGFNAGKDVLDIRKKAEEDLQIV
jgi:2-oxoglutarate ferredoxin oxidoreductase subunit gamma